MLRPFKADPALCDDGDLSGPLLFAFALGSCHLLARALCVRLTRVAASLTPAAPARADGQGELRLHPRLVGAQHARAELAGEPASRPCAGACGAPRFRPRPCSDSWRAGARAVSLRLAPWLQHAANRAVLRRCCLLARKVRALRCVGRPFACAAPVWSALAESNALRAQRLHRLLARRARDDVVHTHRVVAAHLHRAVARGAPWRRLRASLALPDARRRGSACWWRTRARWCTACLRS